MIIPNEMFSTIMKEVVQKAKEKKEKSYRQLMENIQLEVSDEK